MVGHGETLPAHAIPALQTHPSACSPYNSGPFGKIFTRIADSSFALQVGAAIWVRHRLGIPSTYHKHLKTSWSFVYRSLE